MWSYVIAALIAAVPAWFWSKQRPSNLPPGPFNWPFVNNLLSLSFNGKFRDSLALIHAKYGQIVSLNLGFGTWSVFLQGPELIREMLHDSRFSSRNLFSFLTMMDLENTVTFGKGAEWRFKKKSMQQILRNLGVGKQVFAVGIQHEVQKFLVFLEQFEGQAVDIKVPFLIILAFHRFAISQFVREKNTFSILKNR